MDVSGVCLLKSDTIGFRFKKTFQVSSSFSKIETRTETGCRYFGSWWRFYFLFPGEDFRAERGTRWDNLNLQHKFPKALKSPAISEPFFVLTGCKLRLQKQRGSRCSSSFGYWASGCSCHIVGGAANVACLFAAREEASNRRKRNQQIPAFSTWESINRSKCV